MAQTFQRFIDQILHSLHFCYAYIDDILIASTGPEEHKHHLRMVLERLDDHGVLINPTKCVLGVPQLEFLGHLVNSQGIHLLEEKVQPFGISLSPPVGLRGEGIHQGVVISENMELMAFNEMANVLDQQVHAVTASSSRSKAYCYP